MNNKRILIAGPLPSKLKSGGVAVFTKNIAYAFYKKGYYVKVISNFDGYLNNGIQVVKMIHFLSVLRCFKPNIFISSLIYSILFTITPKYILKIHLLHNFSSFREYSFVKVILMHLFDKIVDYCSDLILSNSKFTAFINKIAFNIKSNGIFHIGLSDDELNQIRNAHMYVKHSSVYIGRLVDIKNIKLIYKAFLNINNKYKINFIGYGPKSKWLKRHIVRNNNMSFLGPINHKYILQYYLKSKVFISLNPAEPYGITFLEALLCDDFIIAPNTGGQVDLLKHFPDRCKLVNINNINEIESAIKLGMSSKLKPIDRIFNINKYSYSKTCLDIIRNIHKKY